MQTYTVPKYLYVMWASLVVAVGVGLFRMEWTTVFVSVLTLGLTAYTVHVTNKLTFKIPVSLLTALILFIYATLFLGEVGDFYERFWWWDVVLHTGSAIGFGLIGVITLIFMFKQKTVTASPLLIALFAFAFAVAIGALWEVFEFAMDQLFGLTMQKSGLVDTMADLSVNGVGAFFAASAGYYYLSQNKKTGLSAIISDAVESN